MKKFLILFAVVLNFSTLSAIPIMEPNETEESLIEKLKHPEAENLEALAEFKYSIQIIRENYLAKIGSHEYVTASQRMKLYEMAVKYGQLGMKEMEYAEQIVWYIPDRNTQESVESAIQCAMHAIDSGSPWKAALKIVVTLITDLAPSMVEQYTKMRKHLDQADWYFQESDWYLDAAKNAK